MLARDNASGVGARNGRPRCWPPAPTCRRSSRCRPMSTATGGCTPGFLASATRAGRCLTRCTTSITSWSCAAYWTRRRSTRVGPAGAGLGLPGAAAHRTRRRGDRWLIAPDGTRHDTAAARLRRPDLVKPRGPELRRLAWGGRQAAVHLAELPPSPGTWRAELDTRRAPSGAASRSGPGVAARRPELTRPPTRAVLALPPRHRRPRQWAAGAREPGQRPGSARAAGRAHRAAAGARPAGPLSRPVSRRRDPR